MTQYPQKQETVMVVCKGVSYPFPAVWDGIGWKPRVVHLRTRGDDTASIEGDYTDRDVVDWFKIEKRA